MELFNVKTTRFVSNKVLSLKICERFDISEFPVHVDFKKYFGARALAQLKI